MEVVNFSIELLAFLFLIAIVAGFIDTLAGGGGLISLPALILSGIPPLASLGTNKLQGSMGTAIATFMMFSKKRICWAEHKPLMLSAFIGATVGTVMVQFINTEVLSFVIPLVLLFIGLYFLLAPYLMKKMQSYKLSEHKYKTIIIPAIGFYDGLFGPGTGSFFALSGIICQGKELISATATAKSLNFATNIASLIIFLAAGHVVWVVGILMMLGQGIGAWLGAHFLFKINPAYLRWVVIFMCFGMLIKYTISIGLI